MTRSGFVALIGEPNAGKSTLLNQMVGAKISIVTHKVQTTRTRIRGVSVENQSQIIFVDTPGYQTKHLNLMNRGLNQAVVSALKDVDVVLFLTSPSTVDEIDEKIIQMIPKNTPAILAMNKIDLIKDKNKLLSFIEAYGKFECFKSIVPISIKKKF